MKKIIIPFDGGNFSKGAFSFVCNVNKKNPVLLTGIFLPEVNYASLFFFPSAFAAPAYIPVKEGFDEDVSENNIEEFIRLCNENNIKYKVHEDMYESALPQLSKETRFADLMVIGSEIFYTNNATGPFEYLMHALHNTECPVMIVPEKFNFPSQIILAYDGSESSVYAIKQFVNLFPELCSLKTMLVYAGDEKHNIPDQRLIEELAASHFENLTLNKISGKDKNNFNEWLVEQSNPLLVSGSFSRSDISQLFNRSFIIKTIKDHKAPVFIAHR
jgi:hypothetical protein